MVHLQDQSKTQFSPFASRGKTAVICAILLALSLFAAAPASANERALEINGSGEYWWLLDNMQVSHSIPRSAGFDAVHSGDFDESFELAGGTVPNLDGDKGPVWVKASLRNTSSETVTKQVVLKYPQPRSIVFFVERTGGQFRETERGSAAAIFDSLGGRFPYARITVPGGETRQVYVRIEMPGPILVPLQVYNLDGFGLAMTRDNLLFGLLVGCLLAVALHSGLTFFAAREPAFGWFVLFALGGAGYIFTATGIAKTLIYPGIAFNSNAVLMIAQALGNMASAMFLASYMKARERTPQLHTLILLLAGVSAIGGLTSVLPNTIALPLVAFSVLLGPTLLFSVNVYLAVCRFPGARTLLIGWTALQAGTVWIFLRALNVVPYTEINHYALPCAATFTALHFSWALTSQARKAEHQARHDALTGLSNRIGLAAFDQDSASLFRKVAAVMQVDLDGFKQVNDTLGHAAGDQVLKVFSERLSAALHGEGRVFRLGGDEFVVVISKKRNPPNLVAIANKIVVAASRPIEFRGEVTRIGASVGIAIPQDSDRGLSNILERADSALYNAKRDGKGCVRFSDLATERSVLADALERKAA